MDWFNSLAEKLFYYPKPLWPVASVVGFVLVVLSVPIWGSVILVSVAFGASRSLQTRMIQSWLNFVCGSFFLKFEVTGQENLVAGEPALVVSNHQSLFDIPAAFAVIPGHLRMVAKQELFKIPFFGWCLRKTEFISVDRSSRQSGHLASQKISAQIKSGLNIWVAPEGTRSRDGLLGPFKKGSFAVAIEAQIPIQPILVVDSRWACPKGSLLVRPGTKIQVHILPRIPTQGLKTENRGEIAEKVRAMMSEKMFSMAKLK
jgi:1-acyl-sn-glycerol-3-phosphate acyltransferase